MKYIKSHHKCPNCDLPLVKKGDYLQCVHCGFTRVKGDKK
jgi:ribosomal protein S27AE